MSVPTLSTIGQCCEAFALIATAVILFGLVLFAVMRLRQAADTVDRLLSFAEDDLEPPFMVQEWQRQILDDYYPETPRRRRNRAVKQETAAQLGLYPRRSA